jgi:hypothetical protein
MGPAVTEVEVPSVDPSLSVAANRTGPGDGAIAGRPANSWAVGSTLAAASVAEALAPLPRKVRRSMLLLTPDRSS